MKPPYARGVLTDGILAYLEAQLTAGSIDLGVGDGVAPKGYGWVGGQPGIPSGTFKPYVVLDTGASRQNFKAPLTGDNGSWEQTYSILGGGGSRQQSDGSLDIVRAILPRYERNDANTSKRRLTLGAGDWYVAKLEYTSYGPVARQDPVDPPVWQATDTLIIWLERATA